MMIHDYPEMYVSKAQKVLGTMFDYAVNDCNVSGSVFTKCFIVSNISKKMENGEPKYLLGKSGIEVAREILFETWGKCYTNAPSENFERRKEYWIGWAVAYYQWYSGRKYDEIFQVVPFDTLERMYDPLHEADISKFTEIVDERMREYFPETNLKRIRRLRGYTQRGLAEKAGVSLRSIQMYEQRQKDINKASAESILCLSKVLGCTMEVLLEKR